VSKESLASWSIDKNTYRFNGFLLFIVPFAIFVASFIAVYIVGRSTYIVAVVIPILLFFPLIPTFKEFLNVRNAYKESTIVYITAEGIFVRHPEKGDKLDYLAWEAMKEYDILSSPPKKGISALIPKPTRFLLKGAHEDESIIVEAVGHNDAVLRHYLKGRGIAFGLMK
jgi:hypothetical protein